METTRIFQPWKLHGKGTGNNVDFSTIEITLKKVRGNNMEFLTSKIASKKVRGNDVDFSISQITSKKYVEMTWKPVEIWPSSIDVISTWFVCWAVC